MLQQSLRQTQQRTHALFAPSAQFGFRKNYQPGFYNMRFKPSQGLDGNYIMTNAPYHGPDGAEPVSQTCINKWQLLFQTGSTLFSLATGIN